MLRCQGVRLQVPRPHGTGAWKEAALLTCHPCSNPIPDNPPNLPPLTLLAMPQSMAARMRPTSTAAPMAMPAIAPAAFAPHSVPRWGRGQLVGPAGAMGVGVTVILPFKNTCIAKQVE